MKLYKVPIALVLILVIVDAKFYPLSIYAILSPLLLYPLIFIGITASILFILKKLLRR
jgi:hypothetical protein